MLIPTTLLCMVDACLGGKTGVNQSGAKNQIGTFYPARRIAVYPPFLRTLPEREFRSGLAEVIKTAVIGDRSIGQLLEEALGTRISEGSITEIIKKCLAVKGSVVRSDLFDTGSRMVLNMGHTAGHALESASGFQLTHGEAVGLGMLVEAAMASELGGKRELPAEIRELLLMAGLPCSIGNDRSLDDVRDLIAYDKKTMTDGRIWALPFDWGDCRLTRLTPDEEGKVLSRAMDILRD
jgi:3-dehydroquinate synthase